MIQEIVQKQHKVLPEYKDIEHQIDEKHNVIEYKSEIYVLNEKKSEGFWPNKKKAQEEAAKNLYTQLQEQ